MDSLNPLVVSKATGPDGLPARILKLAAPCPPCLVLVSLRVFFWKLANVHPVFKSGDSRLLTNYRPISVLSILAKVFESLVHKQVYSYFSSNNLLSPAQSGFRPGHSTQDLLIKVTEDWKFALDSDEIVGITFIDLCKALDSIDHTLLLAKLRAYGFDDVSINWFTNYLSNRQQRVVLDNVYSDWAAVHRGVPQGSVLGPNNLPNVICHSHLPTI